MITSAEISDDGLFRYTLTRAWKNFGGRSLVFVMLNPSTADASTDDPTIRRCIGFAKREGYGSVTVVNLFAYRATNPKDLFSPKAEAVNAYGPFNDDRVSTTCRDGVVICAWGAFMAPKSAAVVSMKFLLASANAKTFCLGTTKNGSLRHPLYVRAEQPLVPFSLST